MRPLAVLGIILIALGAVALAYQGRAPTARWSQEYGKTQKYHDTDLLHATPPSGGLRPAGGVAGTMPDSEVPQNKIVPVRAAHGHRLTDNFFDGSERSNGSERSCNLTAGSRRDYCGIRLQSTVGKSRRDAAS